MSEIYRFGNNQHSRILFYSLLAIIFYCFLMPVDPRGVAYFNDKVIHALVFMTLILLAHITHPRANLLKLSALLACYGICTEVAQGFTAERHLSVADWLADLAGILAGALCLRALRITQ